MTTADLPLINAILNSIATCLIIAGLIQIKRGNIQTHKKLMASALVVSALFLICYVTHKWIHGDTKFLATGWIRPVYYAILIPHIILAIVNLPMIITTVTFAVRGQLDHHKKWARWTFPIWLYVSVTGVLVYLILYQWFPNPV